MSRCAQLHLVTTTIGRIMQQHPTRPALGRGLCLLVALLASLDARGGRVDDERRARRLRTLARAQHDEIRQLLRRLEERSASSAVVPPAPSPAPTRLLEDADFYKRTALVILAHDRADALSACLRACLALKEAPRLGLVAASIDAPAAFERMERAVREVSPRVEVWRQQPTPRGPKAFATTPLAKISAHVLAAVDAAFARSVAFVIVLEDDLRVATDFLRLFELGSLRLVDDLPSTWCVSAWNDNAMLSRAGWRPDSIRRTTYFPGLGWMTSREVWAELREAWPWAPTTGFDHWIRAASPVRRRDCLFPEVPRVRHVATTRSTNVKGDQAARLANFAFWRGEGPSPLDAPLTRAEYDATLASLMARADELVVADVPTLLVQAKSLGLWPTDFRGHRRGVVVLRRPPNRTVLVVDDSSDLLPPGRRRALPPGARVVPADRVGASCDTVCHEDRCRDDLLSLVDDCAVLVAQFPCERGCGHQLGIDLPAYVDDPRQPTHQQCLLSNKAALRSTCAARHPSTRRLCVCLPSK